MILPQHYLTTWQGGRTSRRTVATETQSAAVSSSPGLLCDATRGKSKPLRVLFLVVAIFTARWIWVAGITGDYGWAYEPAMRILKGELPYRDYISSLPPLMPYTLAPFVLAFHGNLWSWQLHLYLWWVISLLVGWLLLRKLQAEPQLQAMAMFTAACLSYPASWTGVPHNYAAAALFGTSILATLEFRKCFRTTACVLAGISVTAATLAKQNIGAAACLAGVAGIVEASLAANRIRALPTALGGFVVGAVGTFLPFFIFFGFNAGFGETFKQFAIDGGSGKGIFRMLFHLLPIFYFDPDVPHRHVLDIIVTILVDAFLVSWVISRRLRPFSDQVAARESAAQRWRLWLTIALIFVTLLSLITLIDFPALKSALLRATLYFNYGKLIFFFYATVLAFGTGAIIRAVRIHDRFGFTLCVCLLMLVVSFALSLLQSSIFAAPIAVPLFFWLLKRYGFICDGTWLGIGTSTLALTLASFLPPLTFAPTFEALYALPQRTKFAGLYAARHYAWRIDQLTDNVSSRIRSRPTLWLTMGGPHLAFGGLPVKSVPLIHEDTYGLRAEAPLATYWRYHPPDFVVHQKGMPVRAGSQFFTDEYVTSWLTTEYKLVWNEPKLDLTLWEHIPRR
jgi:hypothetical protein